MSDIWIKTTNTGPTRWRKATNIYIKRFNSGATRWFAAKVVWIKNTSASWLRVWPTSGVFAITDPYITTTSSGSTPLYGNQTVGTNDVIRIGTTYYGRNGTWDPNGFSISSYNYTWPYYSMQENQPGDFDILGNLGTGVYSAPSRALTISDPSDANSVDGKYISFRITANASNALYSNTADSKDSYGKIRAIRRTPINISFSITGSTTVGSVLSVGSSWNTTEARKPDAGRTTIKWYRSDSATAIYSGGGRTEIASGVYQYTLVQADSGKYIVAEETTFNTGSDYDIGVDQFVNGQNQVTAVSSIITAPYRFAFGNTLYVSSNGHIGLDSGWSGYSQMSPGRNIAIFVKDLEQYYLAEYSDNSSYYLYIKSYLYNTSASSLNALDYQIRFYNDSSINYCDVYVVRRGSNLGSTSDFAPGYYSSGTTGHIAGFNSISAGTGFRVFFGGSAATTPLASWTGVPDSLWDVIQTWTYPGSGGDDTFTAVVSAPNQQAQVLTAPTLDSVTVGPQSGPVSANFTGGSGPFYQMFWSTSATAPTVAVSPDATGSSSPLTDNTGPSSTTTNYMYVRSVASIGETSVGPSTLASSWSNGISFNMTSTDVSQISAPTTRATSTFSTSTVKYLDSITWSSGTYNNAASITSVLLYSTNTSNLVAPGGNTSSVFRTSNPYVLDTIDGSPPAYVFAVRDTVVGTNGTTYYFYSNQITSALADGVAFSYGSATGTAGGWTASVNSGTQTGATYSYVSATAGSGTVNSSTGAVTASGLSSAQSSTITVNKSVSGYNTASTTVSGTALTVATYTLSYSANGGSTTPASQTGAQGTSITLAANAGTRSGFTFGGWNIDGTTYAGSSSYTFGSANATATAIWNTVFVAPTAPAPSWTSGGNFQRVTGSSILRWFTDYPSISGNGSITGMDFEIRTTAGGGTLLASGTRSYPGDFTYPYSAAGTVWAFRCGTSDGDISYSASARFARARVRMLGTNGTTYFGTWTGWI
jgi:hypothetical protein